MGARKDEEMDWEDIAKSMRRRLPADLQKAYDQRGSNVRVLVDVVATEIAEAEHRAKARVGELAEVVGVEP